MTPGSYTWSWGSGDSADWMQLNVGSVPTRPTLFISQASGTVTVGWDPQVGNLQSAPALSGPWSNVTTISPHTTPATKSAAYYRVELP